MRAQMRPAGLGVVAPPRVGVVRQWWARVRLARGRCLICERIRRGDQGWICTEECAEVFRASVVW